MGCVNSRADINDLHPNIFQVMNVDELGNLITPGRLEITDSDIVLYQRGKQPVKWPLRCLRRYGYDSEIFSFESGRRCSTGPGIYAFKCCRADQLFNLVQSNIQVCNSNGDDTVSRDLSISAHNPPTIARMTIPPIETNYLDPMPARSNSRVTTRFSHSQQNGIARLGSVGSSSGPMSPQGTMGSPSPPPILTTPAPLAAPPPPLPQSMSQQPAHPHHHHHHHPSAVYVNDQVLSAIAMEIELDNNNKSLRRTIQRSHTVSSSTSSSGFLSEPSAAILPNQESSKSHNNRPPPLSNAGATYINIDISNEQSPLSPVHSISKIGMSSRDEPKDLESSRHAYMNLSPGQETRLETMLERMRPNALPQQIISQQQQNSTGGGAGGGGEWEENRRHCYANLEPAEIEGLRVRYSATTRIDKSTSLLSSPPPAPPPPPPPLPPLLLPISPPAAPPMSSTPPPSELIREVNYAILDLDTNSPSGVSSAAAGNLEHTTSIIPSPPDSPNKPQKGYATIDFNKTAALSHSVNPNVVNDNEGSRKTRHNSTINDFTAAPASRHSSSISE